jgi:ADP-heptose:LPS heptosyltransferase
MLRLRARFEDTEFTAIVTRLNEVKPDFFSIDRKIYTLQPSLKKHTNSILFCSGAEKNSSPRVPLH